MKRVMRTRRLADFEMEPFIASVLRGGVLLSTGLILIGIVWHRVETGQLHFHDLLQGTNVFQFVLADLRHVTSAGLRPFLLTHLGIAVLMVTPYARVAAALLYFTCVERNRMHSILTGCVLALLTYILFLG